MRRVAGAVPVRKVNDKVEYLFVKSSKVKNRYLFPKGGVDRNERPKYAAIRETYEEAGVRGTVLSPKLGKWQVGNERHAMWVMIVTEELSDYPEARTREKVWMSEQQALAMLQERLRCGDNRAAIVQEIFLSAKKRLIESGFVAN